MEERVKLLELQVSVLLEWKRKQEEKDKAARTEVLRKRYMYEKHHRNTHKCISDREHCVCRFNSFQEWISDRESRGLN